MRRAAVAALLAVGCAAPGAVTEVTTIAGATLAPLAVAPGHARVLFFVGSDCPIANSYAPTIEQLGRELRGSAFDCLLVLCDADLDAAAAQRHADEYALTLPIALDPEQRLARAVGATTTPEVAVATADGIAYLGRIDDRWRGFGQDSQVPEHEDLRAALADLRAGRQVAVPRTQAIGCRLPRGR